MKPPEESPKIILASRSPRRRYLLARAGLTFEVIASDIDEEMAPEASPAEYVTALAEAKANHVAERFPDAWVIAADTIVVVEDRILGKPASKADACDMLRRLSGRTHQVLTGYCICRRDRGERFTDSVVTDVLFKTLTPREIEWYVVTGEPFDKAGAYAIQGIGTFLVKSINGSYTNVVGLPVCEVIEFLMQKKVIGFDTPPPPGLYENAKRAELEG